MSIQNTFAGSLNAFQVMNNDELEDRIEELMHQYRDLREDGYNRESLHTLDTLDLATAELRYRSKLESPRNCVEILTSEGVAYTDTFRQWTRLEVIESFASKIVGSFTNHTHSRQSLKIIATRVYFYNRLVAHYEETMQEE